MQVQVKLFATFRRFLPPESEGSGCMLEIPAGARVSDALGQLGIPLDKLDAIAILVNGRHSSADQLLQDGDVVAAFPAMAGG